jgi:two-component system, NarL family, nitrate/nitrite response regulator NarL
VTVVAVVDDHRLFAAALGVALGARGLSVYEPPLATLGEVRARLLERRPDVLLLDLDLGESGDGEVLVEPVAACGTAVLVVSATRDEASIGRCLELGAVGWLPKSAPLEDLCGAVAAVARGEPVLDAAERRRLVDVWHRRRGAVPETSYIERLTPMESQVLARMMDGRSVEQIAASRFVSEATVRSQVRAILVKLNVRSQLQAVALASRARWRPPANDDVA